MSLPFSQSGTNRFMGHRQGETSVRIEPIWLAAGLAMAVMVVCTLFLEPEESFTIATGLLILMVASADLRIGFLSFVILYPFMPASWGINVVDWMPYLTPRRVCCIALALAFVPHWKLAFDTPRVRRVSCLIAGLVAIQVVVGVLSNDPVSAIKRAFGDVVEGYLPLLMAAHLFRTKEQMRTVFIVAVFAIAGACVLGIIEHSIDYNFYDSFTASRDSINTLLKDKTQMTRGFGDAERRVRVAFDHSIIFGLHIMCTLLACIYLFRLRGALRRLLITIGLPIFCMAMVFTYSRGPILGLVCGLIWLGMIGRGTRPILLALVVGCVLSYQILPARARAIMDETISTTTDIGTDELVGGGTARARLYLLQKGIEFSRQNPWLGHGPGQVRQTKMRADKGAVVDFASVDNFYLYVLLNYGLIVLAGTVFLFAYLLATFTRAALRTSDREMAVLLAVAAAICVANYVALITVAWSSTLFWILLGPALRASDLYQPAAKPRRPRRGVRWRRLLNTDTWGNHTMGNWNPPAPRAPGRRPEPRVPAVVECSARVEGAAAASGCDRLPRPGTLGLGFTLLALLSLMTWAVPSFAAPSFYGTTGLFSSPVAAVPPRGTWALGSNYVGRDYRPGASSIAKGTIANYFALTMIPRVEITLVLTNYEGKVGARNLNQGLTPDFNLGGYTVDRTVSTQWLALTQHGNRPAVAFGFRDIFGRSVKHLRAQYGVMSLARGPLTLSAGLGTEALHGPFGGVEYAIIPRISAIAEALYGQSNGGFRITPIKNFQMDLALMGFHSLGGGLSYRRRF